MSGKNQPSQTPRQSPALSAISDLLPIPASLASLDAEGIDLQCELEQIAAGFPETQSEEWNRLLEDLETIDDVHTLRQLVLEKERDLHLAARLGLTVAKKNQEIEVRLRQYAALEELTQRRLAEAEAMSAKWKSELENEQQERDDEMEERINMLARANVELRRELEQIREEFQTFRKEVMQMNGRMDEFGTELNNARRKLAATEKQLEALESDLQSTAEVTQGLQGQFETVVNSNRHHTSKTKQAVKEALRGYSQLMSELETLRGNVVLLNDRQCFSEERISSLIEEYTALLNHAQSTILTLNEAQLEAAAHQGALAQSGTSLLMNGLGLRDEMTGAMARTESGRRRAEIMLASRSQLDLRRPPIGLKDLVRTHPHDPTGGDSTHGNETPPNCVRVLHSYTLF